MSEIIGKLRDELLAWEIFMILRELQILTEQWRCLYSQVRLQSRWDASLPPRNP